MSISAWIADYNNPITPWSSGPQTRYLTLLTSTFAVIVGLLVTELHPLAGSPNQCGRVSAGAASLSIQVGEVTQSSATTVASARATGTTTREMARAARKRGVHPSTRPPTCVKDGGVVRLQYRGALICRTEINRLKPEI